MDDDDDAGYDNECMIIGDEGEDPVNDMEYQYDIVTHL